MLKSPRLIAAIASCAAALCSQNTLASNPPTFGPPAAFGTTFRVNDMAMGDFDGDGIPDVAIMGDSFDTNGYPDGASMEVFFGDGSGGFKSATATIAVNFPGRIAAADVYGPAQSQLIIAGSNLVEIFNWNGANFSDSQIIDLTSTGITATFVVVGDLTKPGSRDILVTDQYSPLNGTLGMVLIPNDGTGNFKPPTLIPTWGCNTRPVLADVNGDGWLDVVLDSPDSSEGGIGTNYLEQGSTVGVLTNNHNGTLSAEVLWGNQTLLTNAAGQIQGFNTVGVAVADVNGDGIADLISAFFKDLNFPNYAYYLSVNLGNGDGTFQDGRAFLMSNGIVKLDTGEILGDGKTDFVTIDYPLVDQNYPGFTVTEITGTGTNLEIASQTDFHTPLVDSTILSYDTLVLGYKSTNGTFATFNNDKSVDVLLGSAQNIYGAGNTISHQFVIFENGSGTTLPPTAVLIVPPSTPGGPITFVASQPSTAPGLTVSIQYSLTPTIPTSWTALPDGNNGHLTAIPGGSGLYSFGTVGTTFYPAGTAVYFRAVTTAQGYAPSVSTNALKSYSLEQAALEIGVRLTSTSDPTGKLQVAHIGDILTNTLSWTNVGNAPAVNLQVTMPVPMYTDAATGAQLQFPSNAVVFNSYGSYVAATPGEKNAKVVWNVANLKPGYSQSVTLLETVGPEVQVPSGIGLPNSYEVKSTTSQPPSPGLGPLGAPGLSVVGAISFTVVPENTTIAPGGLLTYTFTLSNLTSVAVLHPMVAIVVPPYTRFATSYSNGVGKPVPGVTEFGNGIPGTTYKHIFYDNSDKSLVLINFGAAPGKGLAAYPSTTGLDAISFNVVFQAQWGIPSTVSKITGSDYIASFIAPAVYPRFLAEYLAAGDTTATPTTNDFTALLSANSPSIVFSEDESDLVTVPLQGSANGGPLLHLLKTLSAGISDIENGSNGKLVDAVLTNGLITFVLTAYNNGPTDAQDVFIEDTMPNSCAYLSNSLLFATPKTKSTPSTLSSATNGFTVVRDPDGHHLRFEGLRVDAGDNVSLEYTVRVFDGATNSPQPGPLPLTFLDPAVAIDASGLPDPASIGSSTTYNAWFGTYLSQSIEVVSTNQFANPIIRSLVPHPAASTNVDYTAGALIAFYEANPNAIPLTDAEDPSSFLPGMERYYIHYQNNGKVVTGAKIDVPLPANTVFLRAAFVKLTPNVTLGTLPYLPGLIIPNPTGAGIVPPTATHETVTFDLPSLTVGASGDVMVEVIITPGAVQKTGTLVGDPTAPPVVIYDKNVKTPSVKERTKGQQYFNPDEATAFFNSQQVHAYTVPELGMMVTAPLQVHPGDKFNITMTVFNYGDYDSYLSEIDFTIPYNTTYVSNDDAQTIENLPLGATAGNTLSAFAMGYNDPDTNVVNYNSLTNHTVTALTVTLQASGDVGSTISADTTDSVFTDEVYLYGDDWGLLVPPPFSITIVDPSVVITTGTQTYHTSLSLFDDASKGSDVSIVDIGILNGIDYIVASGAGNIVASGAGNIVASGAGNIVASGAGNIVASGAGNLVVWGPASAIQIGNSTGDLELADKDSIVASGAGNIINPEGTLEIVASGAGNIVASGAGNLIAQDGGSLQATGGGSVFAEGASAGANSAENAEVDGYGNQTFAGGAAAIVSTNGSNKRKHPLAKAKSVSTPSQTTGFILTSAPGSKVLIRTPSGNIYGAGGAVYAPNPSP